MCDWCKTGEGIHQLYGAEPDGQFVLSSLICEECYKHFKGPWEWEYIQEEDAV